WCTAEMCTAVIVASLPGLKNLIFKSAKPANTSYERNNHGYMQTGPYQPSLKESYNGQTARGNMDDEVELVFLDRKGSPLSTGTRTGAKDAQDGVTVTTDVKVTRDML
ncbi:hypothetical protein K491DRAFT_595229, partial [Lophiostoma macrostomum CBS 122681]